MRNIPAFFVLMAFGFGCHESSTDMDPRTKMSLEISVKTIGVPFHGENRLVVAYSFPSPSLVQRYFLFPSNYDARADAGLNVTRDRISFRGQSVNTDPAASVLIAWIDERGCLRVTGVTRNIEQLRNPTNAARENLEGLIIDELLNEALPE